MAVIMTFLIGQHVQLDIILPPFGGRPPSASTERPESTPPNFFGHGLCKSVPGLLAYAGNRQNGRSLQGPPDILPPPVSTSDPIWISQPFMDAHVLAQSETACAHHFTGTTRSAQSLCSGRLHCLA